MTVGLAADLYQRMDEGALDLIFAKRRAGDGRGRSFGANKWSGSRPRLAARSRPAIAARPLSSAQHYPEAILAALERANVSWRIACACGSLSGLIGAVVGGLGVGAQSARLKAEGVVALGPQAGLPALGETEFVVVPAPVGQAPRSRRSPTRF